MLDRNRGLRPRHFGQALLRPQRDDFSQRLVRSGPVPGLARRHVLLADVDQLLARSDLSLRPVQDDADLVLAVQKLHVFKDIARCPIGPGECQQLTVAIKLGLPADGQLALEPRFVERGGVEQRTVGDDCPAPVGGGPSEAAVEAGDVAEREMRGLQRPQESRLRIRTEGAQPKRARHTPGVGRNPRVVRQARDLAGGVDGCASIDPHPIARAIGHACVHDEIERGRPPHAVRKPHLRKAAEIELGRLDSRGPALALDRKLDRQLGFRLEDQRRSVRPGLHRDPEPA